MGQSWNLSSPSWDTIPPHTWDQEDGYPGGHTRWPAPENLCTIRLCDEDLNEDQVIDEEDYFLTYDSVASAHFLGVGGLAGMVVVGRQAYTFPGENDIMVVTSTDTGTSFTRSLLISLPDWDTDPFAISGSVDPESVSATIMLQREHGTSEQLDTPATLFVLWRNFRNQWWTTKVEFGFDGSMIQPEPPKRVTVIPDTSYGQAAIGAWESAAGEQAVYVGWSERWSGGAPLENLPGCPSNQTIEVRWFYSWTLEYDLSSPTWQCTEGTTLGQPAWPPGTGVVCVDDVKNEMAHETAWRPCLGDSFSHNPNLNPYHRNSDRPVLGFAYGTYENDKKFYVVNKRAGSSANMHVHVFQDQNIDEPPVWHTSFVSPQKIDSYGYDLSVHQGAYEWNEVLERWERVVNAEVAVAWRQVAYNGEKTVRGVTSADWGRAGTWSSVATLTPAWNSTILEGTHVSLTVRQRCVSDWFEPCTIIPSGDFPPFFAAWSNAPNDNLWVLGRAFIH